MTLYGVWKGGEGTDWHDRKLSTYYYEKAGADFLTETGDPRDGLEGDSARLAALAVGLDDYIDLAERIEEDCAAIDRRTPANWTERALAEITTAGYQPVAKHGVEINIRPLAETEIVPKVVEDRVL